MSLASGSSGNCYYLGCQEGGILIDAGIPARNISQALKGIGVTLDSEHIHGVIVTHEHADHVRTTGVLGGVYHIPIYASVPVHNSIETSRFVSESIGASRRNIELGQCFHVAGFDITSFLVPHDSVLNYGYHICRGDFSMTLATDIGHITSEIQHYASKAKYLIIESNYDTDMLTSGPYPPFLKERVAGPLGHISNTETARLIGEIFNLNLKHIWLCHLSKDNNHPDLCWKTVENHLYYSYGIRVGRTPRMLDHRDHPHDLFDETTEEEHLLDGKDVIIDVLSRTKPSPIFYLED